MIFVCGIGVCVTAWALTQCFPLTDAAFLSALSTLPAAIAEALRSAEDASSDESELDYEQRVRSSLPNILVNRCGLEVVDTVDVMRPELEGLEWDFRAPVLLTTTEPHPNADRGVFDVFPSKPAYLRPPRIAARSLTPTKFAGAPSPPSALYLAIFEVTTTS